MFFDHDGVKIHYRWDGKGEPVLLIHGVGNALDSWDTVVEDLAPHFRVLRLDLRGHGESAKVPVKSMDEFVGDIEALLDHVGVTETHLVGFSLGGLTAQAFVLAHPERVRKVAILGAIAGRTPEEKVKVNERLKILSDLGPLGHFDASVTRWFTPDFVKSHPEVIARRRGQAERMDHACYVAAYRILCDNDFADRLHTVKNEALIATGENDIGSNPRMSRLMHEKIKGSKLHIWPKLQHSILFEAPKEVSKILLPFLKGEMK
ncbi:MAG: alpha/beta hydrolase [Alphaproteobacteria bacterium]